MLTPIQVGFDASLVANYAIPVAFTTVAPRSGYENIHEPLDGISNYTDVFQLLREAETTLNRKVNPTKGA